MRRPEQHPLRAQFGQPAPQLHPADLLVVLDDMVERGSRGHIVGQEEGVAVTHPFFKLRGVFVASGRVDNIDQTRFVVDDRRLADRVVRGRRVAFGEVIEAKLLGSLSLRPFRVGILFSGLHGTYSYDEG